jgi:hypothetical protein
MAFPLPAADAVGEVGHLGQHGVNVRHNVLPVDNNGRALWRPQRDVQHGTIFRDVDLLAAKHRVDPGAQPGLLGKLDEQLERLRIDAVFRVVEVDAGGLRCHALAARRIVREQVTQLQTAHGLIVVGEGLPRRVSGGRSVAGGLRWCGHLRHPF